MARISQRKWRRRILRRKAADSQVEVVFADHQNKPDVGLAIARRWVDQEGVSAIVDLANSGVGLAVNALMHDRNRAMLASATATSDLTGKFCQPTTVQWALDTWALGNAVGRTITKMGGSSWYFISFEYALGKALQRDASEAIVKSGGVVLGSVAHPLGVSDFSSYLLQAQASGAKVIALADTGADAINAIRQSADFHILDGGKQLAALFLQITDIDALGLQAANGLVLSEAFYWDMNDATRAFSARFAQRMNGRMPTEDQAAAYSETLAYLRAAKAANTIEGDKVVAQMRSAPIDDPLFGRVVVRPDGRAVHAMQPVLVPAHSAHPFRTGKPRPSNDDGLSRRYSQSSEGSESHEANRSWPAPASPAGAVHGRSCLFSPLVETPMRPSGPAAG